MNRRRRSFLYLIYGLVGAFALAAGPAWAEVGVLSSTPSTPSQPSQAAPPPGPPAPYDGPDAHRHQGFYLRAFLGVGGLRMTPSEPDMSVGGMAGAAGIALGGAIRENLILYGEVFADVAVDPNIRSGGMSIQTEDTAAGATGFGVGLAYYFMPSNVYVSGTLAATRLRVEQGGTTVGETELGTGVSLMAGKEWWVSRSWGVGVAGQLYAGRMKDRGPNAPTWTATAIALVFSATYN